MQDAFKNEANVAITTYWQLKRTVFPIFLWESLWTNRGIGYQESGF